MWAAHPHGHVNDEHRNFVQAGEQEQQQEDESPRDALAISWQEGVECISRERPSVEGVVEQRPAPR